MGPVQILTYVCLGLFALVTLARVIKYATTPIHLRWELYPVAHESHGRAKYGGSIFEELNWWEKPRESDRFNELKEMFEEIILLKGVFLNNRRLWVFSLPFHFGLYMIIGWLGLLCLSSVLFMLGFGATVWLVQSLKVLTMIAGYGGMALTAIGALGLLHRRITNEDMRKFNSPLEYLNLLFILTVVVIALIVQGTFDPAFSSLGEYITYLITFNPAIIGNPALALEIVLGALLIAYMPLTRMSHFIAKYFMYHQVRWEDEPNPPGSDIEKAIVGALNYGVSWEAKHIQQGKSWGEVVTEAKE